MWRKVFLVWMAVLALLLTNPVQVSLGMDLVRQETQTDAAVAKHGMTGRGVTVAIPGSRNRVEKS
jgi:hypothetical protein